MTRLDRSETDTVCDNDPRSKDYGSPNARGRVYLLGIRQDQFGAGADYVFEKLTSLITDTFAKIHVRMSLNECFGRHGQHTKTKSKIKP